MNKVGDLSVPTCAAEMLDLGQIAARLASVDAHLWRALIDSRSNAGRAWQVAEHARLYAQAVVLAGSLSVAEALANGESRALLMHRRWLEMRIAMLEVQRGYMPC